ncbi:DUF6159 family protein [Myxococcota bacterium]|nr:DUF6159 family protein [Myxococcota bacterium]
MSKIQLTWKNVKNSYRLLSKDKEMLLFPPLHLVTVGTGVFLLLFCMEWLSSILFPIMGDWLAILLVYSIFFVFHFSNTFFSVAIVACVLKRIDGEDPTLIDGFSEALQRIHLIFLWSLLSAFVGMLLKIMERMRYVGFLAIFFNVAWFLLSFLAIPVLVEQKLSPFRALSESGRLLSERWGEACVADFSFSLIAAAFFFYYGILINILYALVFGGDVPTVLFWTGAIGIWSINVTAYSAFRAVLYRYAKDGLVVDSFEKDDLRLAVKSSV